MSQSRLRKSRQRARKLLHRDEFAREGEAAAEERAELLVREPDRPSVVILVAADEITGLRHETLVRDAKQRFGGDGGSRSKTRVPAVQPIAASSVVPAGGHPQ